MMSSMNKKRPRDDQQAAGEAGVVSGEPMERSELVSRADSNSDLNNTSNKSSGDDSASSGSGDHPSSVNSTKNDVSFTKGAPFSAHLSSLTSSEPDSNEGRLGSSDSDEEQCKPPANKAPRRSMEQKPAAHKKDKTTTHKKSFTKNKKKGPDNGPKKPLTAYNTFFQQERKRILDSGVSVVDLYMQEVEPEAPNPKQAMAKVIAKRWNTMSMIDRIKYDLQAKTELKEYKKVVNEQRQKEAEAAPKPVQEASSGGMGSLGMAGMPHNNFMNSYTGNNVVQASLPHHGQDSQMQASHHQGNGGSSDNNLEIMLLRKLLGGNPGVNNGNSMAPQQQRIQPMSPPPAQRGPPPSLEEVLELYMKDPYLFIDVVQSAKKRQAVPVSQGNSVNSAACGQHPQQMHFASPRQQVMDSSSQLGHQQSNNPGMTSAVNKVNELAHLLDSLSAQKAPATSQVPASQQVNNNNSNKSNSAVEMELLKMVMAQQGHAQAQNAPTGPSRPMEAPQQSFMPIAPAPAQAGGAAAPNNAINPMRNNNSNNNNNQELQATLQQLLGMFPTNK